VEYIIYLFKDVSNSDCTPSNDWMPVNIELERMWKEAVVTEFKVLSRDVPEGLNKPTKYLRIIGVPA
jgi:hypothetical protein